MSKTNSSSSVVELDALVIGAGFGGMYALHVLREAGLNVRAYDEADGVGGTWHWNRYPGARVDYPGGPYYSYTFSEELVREFSWPERQPDQATVLKYLNFVADRLDLRRDIKLGTRVAGAVYDEGTQRWNLKTDKGEAVCAQFVICATGALSAAHIPSLPGLDSFSGECYHTGRWPNDKTVSFAGKRVGVIGTGSSGIQSIPVIAEQAAHLTVFQRTAQFTIPAGNKPTDPADVERAHTQWPEIRRIMTSTPIGSPVPASTTSAREHTAEQRRAVFEAAWKKGGLGGVLVESYYDIVTDEEVNGWLADFVREKIRETVKDPATAEKLMPNYLIATKRQVQDEGYYETFNRDNVSLVDLRADPIEEVTEKGIRTKDNDHPLDMIVFATGFDAITGALERINPVGREGISLKERWKKRFNSYLGMTIPGMPNLFMIHGPESPGVLFNMPLGGELESDWIRDCIVHLRDHKLGAIEPAPGVDIEWAKEVEEFANETLFPRTDSWYTGANIEGKHRQFAVHMGGPVYFENLTRIAQAGYPGLITEAELRDLASAG